ncbi:MAG: M23 family metallopeptidase [Bacteroidota bacterium]|nr:M23 family metallopeptidase [Bacteroidota bacterium]
MPHRKYFLDLSDLQFKRVRLPWKSKLIRSILWIGAVVVISWGYGAAFNKFFGSRKNKMLTQEIESIKLEYSLLGRQINNSIKVLDGLEQSDAQRYRPILDMTPVPETVRKMGSGGVNKYADLEGFDNSDLMVSFQKKVDDIKNRTTIQYQSFSTIEDRKNEWKREMEHLPMISPVNVIYRLGDGIKFREKHPVLGTPQWHHGQDICTPYGSEVFATGSGKVIQAGWEGGFGNCIVIDHGYGYRSTYGHLSNIKVTVGINVKRGDLIGLTGSTGTSSGPHLHYQIDLYGQYKNPLYYFNNDLTENEYFDMIQSLTAQSKLR